MSINEIDVSGPVSHPLAIRPVAGVRRGREATVMMIRGSSPGAGSEGSLARPVGTTDELSQVLAVVGRGASSHRGGMSGGRDRARPELRRRGDRRGRDSRPEILPRPARLARRDLPARRPGGGSLARDDLRLVHASRGGARSSRARRPDRRLCLHRAVRLPPLPLGFPAGEPDAGASEDRHGRGVQSGRGLDSSRASSTPTATSGRFRASSSTRPTGSMRAGARRNPSTRSGTRTRIRGSSRWTDRGFRSELGRAPARLPAAPADQLEATGNGSETRTRPARSLARPGVLTGRASQAPKRCAITGARRRRRPSGADPAHRPGSLPWYWPRSGWGCCLIPCSAPSCSRC